MGAMERNRTYHELIWARIQETLPSMIEFYNLHLGLKKAHVESCPLLKLALWHCRRRTNGENGKNSSRIQVNKSEICSIPIHWFTLKSVLGSQTSQADYIA